MHACICQAPNFTIAIVSESKNYSGGSCCVFVGFAAEDRYTYRRADSIPSKKL